MNHRPFKPIGLVIGAVIGAGALAGTAATVLADPLSAQGGPQLRVDKRTDTFPATTNQPVWQDVPGAVVRVIVSANESRLYDVPFFAESKCSGPMTGKCVVRIIAENPVLGVIELNPAAGTDYAFDTNVPGPPDDDEEGHGMERSARLLGDENGRAYDIKVQYGVTNNNTTFTLDDWHLAVLTNQ